MAQDTDNRREDQIYDINSTFVTGGLQTDVSEVNQPQGTQRYVLNGIRETVNKDINTLSNDYSNKQLDTTDVPLNTTVGEKDYLLGSIYLNDDEFVLFILTYVLEGEEVTNQISKLCLFNSVTKTMQLLISDENSEEEDKLHFNEHHQIQSIYRLRRGCDRTIYFTDNFNAPRTINIDKPYNYYGVNETYAISTKFNLIRTYNKIPEFENIEVKSGGKLLPGGYNLTIRFLDDDLNPTDWITTTNVIIVSNFDGDTHYTKMKGSTAKATDWQNFGETDKLIQASVKSNSIDTNFRFLQFGLIYANSGDGTIGGVHVSPMIGIEEEGSAPDYYTYQFTGTVEYDKDTIESVGLGPINVGKAKTITSTQNRLLLGNTESKQVDWCRLQKYASKIAACAEIKYINYDSKTKTNNPANPQHNLEDNGYMPGEIYSFGIVYVFDDGTTSPAYHIPGSGGSTSVLDPDNDPSPRPGSKYQRQMSLDNKCSSIKYIDRNGCEDSDYWGKDYLGNDLTGQYVRHHRFPTRAEIGEPVMIATHDYQCEKIECGTTNFKEYCQNSYYIKIPYHKVNPHYKRHHSSFDIDIYLAIYSETQTSYYFTDDHYYYTIERVTKTIDIEDWEASDTYKDGKSYFCLDLGVYSYLPRILGISEQPVLYTRSSGDRGERFGWETTAGYLKIKYKSEGSGQNNTWVENPTISNIQSNYHKPTGDYPLTEDGENLRYIFDDVIIHKDNSGTVGDNENIRGRYKRLRDKRRFLHNATKHDGSWSTNIDVSFYNYLTTNNIDYYNLSVVNVQKSDKNGNVSNNEPRPIVLPKRDLNFDNCKNQYSQNYTPILGIHFWNIEIPSLKDTNGNKIIGYYIVRNKRDDDNKTILDSAITIPLSQRYEQNKKGEYISYGFTDIKSTQERGNEIISTDAVGFINPEFKYLKKKYKNFTFVKEGYLVPHLIKTAFQFDGCSNTDTSSLVSTCSYRNQEVNSFDTDFIIEDVQTGTSYNKKENRKEEKDNDGFELYSLIRERYYQYRLSNANEVVCSPSKVVYLDALDDTIMEAKTSGELRLIHNLSSDNAIGIMEMGEGSTLTGTTQQQDDFYKNINYGYLKVDVANPYGNFRQLPYYKESKNMIPMSYEDEGTYNTTVFSGDTTVTPMKYWNSVFYNTRLRLRRKQKYLWRIVVGAISTAAAVVGTVFASIYSGGAALSTGIATIKASFSLMMSGIKMGKANLLYTKLYFKGLQSGLEDMWTKYWLKNTNPLDDQVQWVFEISNSFWFESTINQFWRVGTSGDLPDFLEPLKIYNTQDYVTYITNKMTVADNDRNNGRLYQGFATAEYYEVNPDYVRGNIQKAFYHLPIQYDCCSKCLERFPHRVMYSEVSFQEELTDNYTTFLANNYRDIPGETGEITNLFQQDTFLYIQTEEGLWNMPVGTQEIKTQGLTTYLGNGAFFSNEPQRISDAGLGSKYQHGTLITKDGIFFIDDQYGKVYLLQKGKTAYGKSTLGTPIPIIDLGMSYWGKDNIKSFTDEEYRKEHGGLHYPHLDNTASEGGMGYVAVYDEKYERYILTKKDKVVKPYYLDGNNNRVYPNFTEFNGDYYDLDRGMITPPPIGTGWIFVGFKDNFAIWESQTSLPSGTVPGASIVQYQEGYKTLTDKIIQIKFVDENNNPLTDEQITQYNINLTTVTVNYTVNGTLQPSASCDLSGTGVFDSTAIDIHSQVEVTNIQSILNTIFQNSNQSYNVDNIIYTIEEVENDCSSILTITITVPVSTSNECSLTIIKEFNNLFTQERLEEVLALFRKNPTPEPEPEFEEVEIDGLNSDNTMVIIDGAEVQPQEDIYYRDINTGKIYILNNGVLEETTEPEPEPQEPGPEITFTWVDNEESIIKTYEVIMDTCYLDSRGRGIFEFSPITIDCDEIDWNEIKSDIISTVDESGLFVDSPTFHIDNSSTLTGNNAKVLTLVNVFDDDENNQDDRNLSDVVEEPIENQRSILRDGTPCSDDTKYDITEIDVTQLRWHYDLAYTQLEKLTIDPAETIDNSWTISFNMKTMSWQSFHSYLPNFYIGAKDVFYSFKLDEEGLWRHNVEGNFGTYYDKHYDFIVDFVSVSENGIATRVWNDVYVIADVKRYDDTLKDYYDINDVFFNKAIVWNHRQCSKELELILKENQQDENYLYNQIINEDGKITVDRNERNWAFNGFRDNVNHNQKQPMWIKKYDGNVKELNMDIFDFGNNVLQNWYETEIFRGKFLEVMLKFTNFAPEIIIPSEDEEEDDVIIPEVDNTNVKIILYFTIEGRNKTVR